MSDTLDKKYAPIINEVEGFELHGITTVNHKPHPYMIGSKHVVVASDKYGGILDDRVMKEVPCAYGRCGLSYEQHTYDRICFLKFTKDMSNEYASKQLKVIADLVKKDFEEDKIDGFGFIKTEFKITD